MAATPQTPRAVACGHARAIGIHFVSETWDPGDMLAPQSITTRWRQFEQAFVPNPGPLGESTWEHAQPCPACGALLTFEITQQTYLCIDGRRLLDLPRSPLKRAALRSVLMAATGMSAFVCIPLVLGLVLLLLARAPDEALSWSGWVALFGVVPFAGVMLALFVAIPLHGRLARRWRIAIPVGSDSALQTMYADVPGDPENRIVSVRLVGHDADHHLIRCEPDNPQQCAETPAQLGHAQKAVGRGDLVHETPVGHYADWLLGYR